MTWSDQVAKAIYNLVKELFEGLETGKKGGKKGDPLKKSLSFILIKSNQVILSQEWHNHQILTKEYIFEKNQ